MTMIAKTSDHDRDLGCCYGAGDENRTRTISLGSAAVTAARGPDLAFLTVMSNRG
jgi:hypothetical protein